MYQMSKAKLGQPVVNTLSHPLIVYRTADLYSKGNKTLNEPCVVVRCGALARVVGGERAVGVAGERPVNVRGGMSALATLFKLIERNTLHSFNTLLQSWLFRYVLAEYTQCILYFNFAINIIFCV